MAHSVGEEQSRCEQLCSGCGGEAGGLCSRKAENIWFQIPDSTHLLKGHTANILWNAEFWSLVERGGSLLISCSPHVALTLWNTVLRRRALSLCKIMWKSSVHFKLNPFKLLQVSVLFKSLEKCAFSFWFLNKLSDSVIHKEEWFLYFLLPSAHPYFLHIGSSSACIFFNH